MRLLRETPSKAANEVIKRAITLVQENVSNPLLAAYVSGSYANGYAVPTSDLDLYVIFRDELTKDDEAAYGQFGPALESLEPAVDLVPYSLGKLRELGQVGMATHFLHVWGETVHGEIPEPSLDDYAYRAMHGAYLYMGRTRKVKPYHWPLEFPEPEDAFKGYGWRKMAFGGKEVGSIKELVVMAGWMATGLIAWRGKMLVPTKKECPGLFEAVVGGKEAATFRGITELCRNKLHYLLPESPADKAALEELLPGVLALENYFLKEYQDFLIENLANANPVRRRTSVIRLGEIRYPNSRSEEALRGFKPEDESQEKAFSKTRDFFGF